MLPPSGSHQFMMASLQPHARHVSSKIGDGILAIHNGLTPAPRRPVSSKNGELLRGYIATIQAPAHPSSSKICDGISAPQRSRSRHLTMATPALFQFYQRSRSQITTHFSWQDAPWRGLLPTEWTKAMFTYVATVPCRPALVLAAQIGLTQTPPLAYEWYSSRHMLSIDSHTCYSYWSITWTSQPVNWPILRAHDPTWHRACFFQLII
jgi:hypothetical protein